MTDESTAHATRAEANARALATDHLMEDLGRRTAGGGLIAVVGQGVQMTITVATLVVLARLLTPADFGLVAMATAVTIFIGLFTDLGLSAATVQRKSIDQETVSALFYVNVAMGVLIMLVAIAAAPVAAWIYGDERVFWLVIALAIPIPIAASAAQHNALLQRNMRWIVIQCVRLAPQLVGAVVAILLAWQTNFGYWALVAQAWTIAILGLIISWTACPWRPGRVRDWDNARSALHFGLHLTGFNFVNYFHRQFDNVLIGWRWGATELGYYTRAYQLLMLPLSLINGPVGTAVIPALSRLQADPARWRKLLLEALGIITLVSSGITALMIATAYPLIEIVLGPEWSEAAGIFALLSISMFGATPMNAMGWVYISLGRTRRMLAWALIVTPTYVLSFLLGIPYGAKGVALAYSTAICLAAVPCIAFAVNATAASVRDVLRVVLPPTSAGILAAVVGALWLQKQSASSVVDFLIAGGLTGTIYLTCAAILITFDPCYMHLKQMSSRTFLSVLASSTPER